MSLIVVYLLISAGWPSNELGYIALYLAHVTFFQPAIPSRIFRLIAPIANYCYSYR